MRLQTIEPKDIAPCGVACFACSAQFNKRKPCAGCRSPVQLITRKSCVTCLIKQCAFEKGLSWCFECVNFPCMRIKKLNARYKKNYDVDLILTGEMARSDMNDFLEWEKRLFTCKACGGVSDQHHGVCIECGGTTRK